LKRFNDEAEKLGRQTLTLDQVISYTFIAELDLLKDSREDIRGLAWTLPAVREGIVLWLKMQRAQEEIQRIGVEARRLELWIAQSSIEYQETISRLMSLDPLLAAELRERYDMQKVDDEYNLMYLRRLYLLTSGTPAAKFISPLTTPKDLPQTDTAEEITDSDSESEEDECVVGEFEKLTNFLENEHV
jgi:hypothetical protein